MASFGKKSKSLLASCDSRLQAVFYEVVRYYDVKILIGHRGQVEQEMAYAEERSKLKWPLSKHNLHPSLAVDVIPYPLDWKDRERFYYMAGLVMGIAALLGIKIRWGGDWDSDTDFKDQTFDDLVHFELER